MANGRTLRTLCRRAGAVAGLMALALPAYTQSSAPAPSAATPADSAPTTATAAAATPTPAAPARPQMPEYGPLVAPRPLEMPIAETRLGKLTVAEAQLFYRINQVPTLPAMPYVSAQVPEWPTDALDKLGWWIASRKVAEHVADTLTTNPATQKFAQMSFESRRETIIFHIVQRSRVEDKVTSPSEEALRKYYEEHQAKFKQPFQFRMRHLIRLTYAPYIVKSEDLTASDPLASIAAKVSGDPARSAMVREDTPGRPLRAEEGKLLKPLFEGEKLWVPMNDEQAGQVKANLEKSLEQLKQGVTFEELARKYSETESKGEVSPPLPSGTKPILPELVEAARSTPVGGISPIFRTKHGWQVIEVVDRIEEGTRSYEASRPEIVAMMRQQQEEKLKQELTNDLVNVPELAIDVDKFVNADSLTSDTIVMRVGKHAFPWEAVRDIWSRGGQPTTEETIRQNLVPRIEKIMLVLAEPLIAAELKDPNSEYSRLLAHIRSQLVGSSYLQKISRDAAAGAITEEKLHALYDSVKDRLHEPERLAFTSMVMRPTAEQLAAGDEARANALAELTQKMSQTLAGLKTPEEFTNTAAVINESILNQNLQPEKEDEPVTLDNIKEPIREKIADLGEGKWSEPFVIEGDRVVSVLVTKRIPASTATFEQVRPQLEEQVLRRDTFELMQRNAEALLAQYQYRALLK